LRSHQVEIDVIGNNIANINTPGFKGSRVLFRESLTQLLRGAQAPTSEKGGLDPLQVGMGCLTGSIQTTFEQGNLESTGYATDLALQGDGFFVVSDGERNYFTRNGSFSLDALGRFIDPSTGFVVQGYMADASGNIAPGTAITAIQLPFGQTAPPKATTEVVLGGNLNADSNAKGTVIRSSALYDSGSAADGTSLLTDLESSSGASCGIVAGDIVTISGEVGGTAVTPTQLTVTGSTTLADLEAAIEQTFGLASGSVEIGADGKITVTGNTGTANELSGVSVVATDSTGTTERTQFNSLMDMALIERAADAGTASLSATIYDSLGTAHELTLTFTKTANPNEWSWVATTSGEDTILSGGSGNVVFGSDGSLASFTYANGATAISLDPGSSSANAISISINPGTVGETDGLTQFGSPSTALALRQDGYAMGSLEGMSVDEEGKIVGTFTNGTNRVLAQLALAAFVNPSGLRDTGGSMFVETANSGGALLGKANSHIRTTVSAGALEMSTVDLAREFTNLIVAQRGFQANARIIRDGDQMLAELVNIKR